MLRVTNVSGSTLSVAERAVPPNGQVDVSELTPMLEYLKKRGAVTIARVVPPSSPPPPPKPAVIVPKPKPREHKPSTEES